MAVRTRRKKVAEEQENKIVLEEPKEERDADVGEIKAKVEEKVDEQIQPEVQKKKAPNPADSKEYPAYRYHKEQGQRLVNSAAEDRALGSGWRHTPQDF